MTDFTVVLAGQTYTLKPLPIRASREWRKRIAIPFDELTRTLASAGSIELTSGTGLAGLLQTLSGTLIGSTDLVIEMLFDYAPELAADRERIEEAATDAEALAAFAQVLKAAYPFGSLLDLVRTGPAKAPTSKK